MLAELAIPRPRTRAECLEEARPCPWVACEHHLLLEVTARSSSAQDSRPTSLRLNRPHVGRGRRPGLRANAAADLVRDWIDDAVRELALMPFTCELDVADAFPDGLYPAAIGELLGVAEQLVDRDVRRLKPLLRRSKLREHQDHDERDGVPVRDHGVRVRPGARGAA